MSRTGKKPITVPQGVQVQIEGNNITVKGPKGQLSRELSGEISVELEDGCIRVKRHSDRPQHRALHGLTRSLIDNMVTGVTDGFTRTLELVGVGYRVSMQGKNLVLNVGFSIRWFLSPNRTWRSRCPATLRC
jgi:large subunit ribosomal protein L6